MTQASRAASAPGQSPTSPGADALRLASSESLHDDPLAPGPSLETQERIKAELEAASGSFQRLKLVRDTWCALWFWPLEGVTDLPMRAGFLASARLLLGSTPPKPSERSLISARVGFEIDALLAATPDGEVPDTSLLSDAVPWFGRGHTLATEQAIHHWELVFPEVLGPQRSRHAPRDEPNASSTSTGQSAHHAERDGYVGPRGFDLILGNPPWIKAGWADAAVLSEIEPLLGVREARSADFNERRVELLSRGLPPRVRGVWETVRNVGWDSIPTRLGCHAGRRSAGTR